MQRLSPVFILFFLSAASALQAMDFRPVFDGAVQQFQLLPDDRILVSGSFNRVNGRHCPNLCRLNPDGSVDSGFGPVFLRPNFVSTHFGPPLMTFQADGRILLYGTTPGANVPWMLNYTHEGAMMRLTETGSHDGSFRITQLGHAPSRFANVRAVAMLDDGRLFVGGSFSSINGVSRRNLALLLPNGEVDPNFNANLSLPADPDNRDSVVVISIDDGGKLLVVTDRFSSSKALQRLNADGSLDLTFGTLPLAFNSNIRSLIPLPGQQLLVGGRFAFGAGDLQGIVRLDATGLVDPSFQAHTPDRVEVMERMADGRVLVGGELTEFNGSSVLRLVRILPNGQTDLSFSSLIEQGSLVHGFSALPPFAVRNLALDSAGNILVGGTFHGADNQIQARLLKLDASGALLRDPDPEANNTVFTFALQPDGHVLIGGRFTEMGGQARARLARLKPDGSLDPDFITGTSDTVRAIGVQRDGKLVIAGAFGTLAGQPRSRIGRLHPDGSLDPSFNPNVTNAVRCLAIQADGAILIGGVLTEVGGVARSRLARLHPDGSLDVNFNPAPNGQVRSITLDRQGRILVAGSFTSIGGVAQARLARLNPDGSVDTDFSPTIDDEVRSVAIQTRGQIRITGLFSTVNAAPRAGMAVLAEGGELDNLFPSISFDGPVHASINFSSISDLPTHSESYFVGDFSAVQGQSRAGFVSFRSDSSATQDRRYNANHNLYAMLVTEDGRLILGGDFSSINSVNRSRLATVHTRTLGRSRAAPFPSSDPFIYFLDRVGPHLEHPLHFEFSLDGIEFTPFDSTVTFTPPAQNYYMRITGRSRAGFANSSSGLIEILDYLPGRGDVLFRDNFQ